MELKNMPNGQLIKRLIELHIGRHIFQGDKSLKYETEIKEITDELDKRLGKI